MYFVFYAATTTFKKMREKKAEFFVLLGPFVQLVQHLSTLGPGRLYQAIDSLAHFYFVGFVGDGGQINDDVIAS